MSILDIIVLTSILDEIDHNSAKKNEKPESQNPVEACIMHDSMSVIFNDVDDDEIEEFVNFLDGYLCKYTREENEFEISANEAVLYRILLYLTNEYEEIALY